MTTPSVSFVLAAFLSAAVFFFSSCSEDERGVSASGKVSLRIHVAGISAGGEESLTRAALEPETVVLTADDGTPVEFTLSVDPASVTRATNPMPDGIKYRVVAYKSDDSSYAGEELFTAGIEGTLILPVLASGYYKLVAISYNTTADPGAVGLDADGDGNVYTITVEPSNDLLHWVGGIAGNGEAGIHDTPITFKHRFTKLTVRATSTLTGNNITGVPASATLTPGYKGLLSLLMDNAPAEYGNASAAQTFSFNTTNNDTVAASTTTRYVFTGDDNPVTLTFYGTLTVNAPSGNKTLSTPSVKFNSALQMGYSYTLTMRVEASKGNYYPFASAIGPTYEVTIPLGSANAYSYIDKTGDPQTVGSLTFLRYNLGADPSMTPKEQMAYPHTDKKNIRVYGGLFQWGRMDVYHALRDAWADVPGSFTTTQYTISNYDPNSTSQKFVKNTYYWLYSNYLLSNLWGNGLGLSLQTNFNDFVFEPTPFITPNLYNPCPSGYRVPTQHEWALILNEGGNSTDTINDYFRPENGANTISSGTTWYIPANNTNVVWVRVSDGKPSPYTAWSPFQNTMNGYALYSLSSLNGVSSYNDLNTVFDPDVDLTDDSAPDPLMFLPAAGFRLGNSTYETLDVTDTGSFGYYWSSTVGDDSSWKQSYLLLLSRFNVRLSGGSRVYGASVRCIKVL